MKRKYGRIIIFFLFIMSICGCGKDGGKNVTEDNSKNNQEIAFCNEWKTYETIDDDTEKWMTVDYSDKKLFDDLSMILMDNFFESNKDYVYILNKYYKEDENFELEYYLSVIDTITMEEKTKRVLYREGIGEERQDIEEIAVFLQKMKDGIIYVSGIDMLNNEFCLFCTEINEEYEVTGFYSVWMNQEGEIESISSLSSIMEENYNSSNMYYLNTYLEGICDNKENYYIVNSDDSEIYHVNILQKSIDIIKVNSMKNTLHYTCSTSEGNPVLEYIDEKQQTNIIVLQDSNYKVLYQGKGEIAVTRYLRENGDSIFMISNKLLLWNAENGSCQCICNTDGIQSADCKFIWQNSQGELLLFISEKSGIFINKLSNSKVTSTMELVLFEIFSDEYIETCAAEYSRKHPGINIVIDKNEEDWTIAMNHLLADISQGKGPDMLIINREQAEKMYQAGMLLSLENCLSDELEKVIFPNVLQYCRFDDVLYGVPYNVYINTLLVSENTWTKNTWSTKDIINLITENKMENIFGTYYYYDAESILYDICLRNIENTGFVDFDMNKCFFDTEDFRAVLRFCKENGKKDENENYRSDDEVINEIKNGKTLTLLMEGDFLRYSKRRSMLGDDYYCIGYPTLSNNGNLISCYSALGVNKTTKYSEEAKDFIQFVLSKESQLNYSVGWVRKDIYTDCIYEHTDISDNPIILMDEYKYIPLSGREDGTSYAEEYLDIVENAVLQSQEYEIENIVFEEAAAFFANQKSEEEVAKIIQRRVQLYLDERN